MYNMTLSSCTTVHNTELFVTNEIMPVNECTYRQTDTADGHEDCWFASNDERLLQRFAQNEFRTAQTTNTLREEAEGRTGRLGNERRLFCSRTTRTSVMPRETCRIRHNWADNNPRGRRLVCSGGDYWGGDWTGMGDGRSSSWADYHSFCRVLDDIEAAGQTDDHQ